MGRRCPIADPRAKLRTQTGDIFPAGPPSQAAALGLGAAPRPSPWGVPRLAGGGVTSHPGRRGHRRYGNLSVANSKGLPGPPPWEPAARSGVCYLPPPLSRRGSHCRVQHLWTPLSSVWSSPEGPELGSDMLLLPFPAPSERRGVGEARQVRCTERSSPRAKGRPGPAAGTQGPTPGWRAGGPRPAREEGRPAGGRCFPCTPWV